MNWLPLTEDKIEGSATVLTFPGIESDTAEMLMRLPQEKLTQLKELIDHGGNIKQLKSGNYCHLSAS